MSSLANLVWVNAPAALIGASSRSIATHRSFMGVPDRFASTLKVDPGEIEINRTGHPRQREPRRLRGGVKSPGETPEKLAAEMNLEACRNLGLGVTAGGIELNLGEAFHMGEVGAQKRSDAGA